MIQYYNVVRAFFLAKISIRIILDFYVFSTLKIIRLYFESRN